MADVIPFPIKPVCTNIYSTCTYTDCVLKAKFAALGPGHYLGNCGRYVLDWMGRSHVPQTGDSHET